MNDQERNGDLDHVPEGLATAISTASGLTAASDPGPFFHGTSHHLETGTLLTPGYPSNYRPDILMNHVYFTALKDGAGLAAELAVLLTGNPTAHVYLVEPTGEYEDDPNVTDKKFPGNPTRSYRTSEALVILDEVHDWERLSEEQRATWQERLAAMTAESAPILN